jgi:hypothetical protein
LGHSASGKSSFTEEVKAEEVEGLFGGAGAEDVRVAG